MSRAILVALNYHPLILTCRLICRCSPLPPMSTKYRKRRRNRTTQSCLNCHTSKRKVSSPIHLSKRNLIHHNQCDRKRPCQRCIQLGLVSFCSLQALPITHHRFIKTGLCVYEIDDPALRLVVSSSMSHATDYVAF